MASSSNTVSSGSTPSESTHLEDVVKIASSFKNRVSTYEISNVKKDELNMKITLEEIKPKFINLIKECLEKHMSLKVNLEQHCLYCLEKQNLVDVKSFNTKNIIVTHGSNLESLFDEFSDMINSQASEFEEKDSGWALLEILQLTININKYNPLKASSYIPLPKEIQMKRGVLNIKNEDNKCFMWSILAHLHPINKHAERVTKYSQYLDQLNFSGINFPIKLSDISKFEKLNNISVNVFGLENLFDDFTSQWKNKITGPLYLTCCKKQTHCNLLLVTNDKGQSHYCLIKDISRLVRSQISKHEEIKFLCDSCLSFFSTEERYLRHIKRDCDKVVADLPSIKMKRLNDGTLIPHNIAKFKNYEKSLKIPFVIYADFESVLKSVDTCEPNPMYSYNHQTHIHIPYSFAYYIKCSFNESFSKLKMYRSQSVNEDVIEIFNQWITNDVIEIYSKFLKNSIPLSMSEEEEKIFQSSLKCHICDKPFTDLNDKVRDHCHLQGCFRGASHSICNLNYKIPDFIPLFCHNLSGYDAHLFIKHFAKNKSTLDVIAQNKERYISFTKHIKVDSFANDKGIINNKYIRLRCLDSFKFLPSSLNDLAKNLLDENCVEIKKYFSNDEQFKFIRQKGVFPYSYLDNLEKLNENCLPNFSSFYCKLNNTNISEDEYERAHKVWNLFNCQTLGEYSDIYLKSDVLLLADIFETFRNFCLNIYKLDPAQYYTSPGLSWDALLKYTQIELELLTDTDMLHFIKQGIRGGISQCSKRKVLANNRFLPNFDKSLPENYLMYLDATNLYGAAMSEYLPYGGFEWVENIAEFNIIDVPDISNVGFILEVDLRYPQELHNSHNDLPFCVENLVPPTSKFKNSKLIPNLSNKTHYIIHCQNLKQALKHGLELEKIHRILKFKQSPWMKPYIDLNTQMRNNAKNSFEKQFFKLMNNSVFGKTMESVDKRVNVKLVTHWKNNGRRLGAETLIAKPHFKNIRIFSEDFCAIQMNKVSVTYDKPIFVGFSILELSKVIMYSFFYDFLKPKYKDNVSLCYMDTDSFILDIKTSNFYTDMIQHLDKFDTSNYTYDNIYEIPITPSLLGKMKDEFKGTVLHAFYGTGAKAYCVDDGTEEKIKKAKGIKYSAVKHNLKLKDYENIVSHLNNNVFCKMNLIRSHLHQLETRTVNKVALSYSDDKRYLCDNYKTLAWGHYAIPNSILPTS